jgi:hypothetical protein
VLEALEVAVEWAEAHPSNATKVVNIFESSGNKLKKTEEHVDLVWAKTDHGKAADQTPKYFKNFGGIKPADMTKLTGARNTRRLKHVMLGKLLWNSLTADFQLELLSHEKKYKVDDNIDRVLLWQFIVDLVNPSTKVSVANLKDKIEAAKLSNFEHDVNKFNTWFSDKRNLIVKEVGENRYTEYLRCLFKTYLTAVDPKFVEAVTQEQRLWMMGRQADTYKYANLMSFALKLFNNCIALSEWKGGKGQLADKTSTCGEEPKFLALLTEIQTAIRGGSLMSNPGVPMTVVPAHEKGPITAALREAAEGPKVQREDRKSATLTT